MKGFTKAFVILTVSTTALGSRKDGQEPHNRGSPPYPVRELLEQGRNMYDTALKEHMHGSSAKAIKRHMKGAVLSGQERETGVQLFRMERSMNRAFKEKRMAHMHEYEKHYGRSLQPELFRKPRSANVMALASSKVEFLRNGRHTKETEDFIEASTRRVGDVPPITKRP